MTAAIPLGVIIAYNGAGYLKYKRQYMELYKQSQSLHKCVVYTLRKDLKKGDVVYENNLVEHIINIDENSEIEFLEKQDIVGKELKLDIDKGSIIDQSIIHVQEKADDDLRLHMYSGIGLNSEILEGSVIDIRIKFPNGEDYVVTGQKKVVKREEDNIFIFVNEEEILKLSCAQTDVSLYEGTKIYAVKYIYDYQQSAESDYPVNMYVGGLGVWTPNLIDSIFTDTMNERRNELEENLRQFHH